MYQHHIYVRSFLEHIGTRFQVQIEGRALKKPSRKLPTSKNHTQLPTCGGSYLPHVLILSECDFVIFTSNIKGGQRLRIHPCLFVCMSVCL